MEDAVERAVRRALCAAGTGAPARAAVEVEGAPGDRSPRPAKDWLAAARAALREPVPGLPEGVFVELSAGRSQRGPTLTAEWTGAARGSATWRTADLVASKA